MSSAAVFAKSSEHPEEKHVRFNDENMSYNGVPDQRKRQIKRYRRYVEKFPSDEFTRKGYIPCDDVLHLCWGGNYGLHKRENLDNSKINKYIQKYEKAFWGNEILFGIYQNFCDTLMKEEKEETVQMKIEANCVNFLYAKHGIDINFGLLADSYKRIGNVRLYWLWMRIKEAAKYY